MQELSFTEKALRKLEVKKSRKKFIIYYIWLVLLVLGACLALAFELEFLDILCGVLFFVSEGIWQYRKRKAKEAIVTKKVDT